MASKKCYIGDGDLEKDKDQNGLKRNENSLVTTLENLESYYAKYILNPEVKEVYDQAKVINKDFMHDLVYRYLNMIEDKIVR